MGKTSVESRLNIPGKWAWTGMEAPGFLTLLFIMWSLPRELAMGMEGESRMALPWENWAMAALFTIHYLYRALLSPLVLNPSMSPIHPVIFLAALQFQLCNAICLGGWLAGYGPVTATDWQDRKLAVVTGTILFALGLLGNMYHDDVLREIRRSAAREMQRREKRRDDPNENDADEEGQEPKTNPRSVAKVYMVPENGLFRWVLYPHYLCEWIEWIGFWFIGGWACVPARCFVVNEVASMLPRAMIGKRWYVRRFGKAKVGNRKAVIPWAV
ncbi:hypothetical protein MMC07_006383 [Pseudocyphellaria aurata]|nr:hypothetical protein [Pseudocyphellaria aurata]